MAYRLLIIAGEHSQLHDFPRQLGADVEVKVVEMANDALWEIRSDAPHAIVSEIDLPDMSGFELAEILPNFDVPTRIVLVDQKLDPSAQQRANELGVHQLLVGPSAADLSAAVYAAMRAADDVKQAIVEEAPPPPPVQAEPAAPRPTPIIERIERTPLPSESAPPSVERPASHIERIERTPPPAAEPEEPPRPQRRIVPNPDPPYQPPARPSTRRIVPTRSTSSTGRLSDRARENRAAPSATPSTPATPPPVAPSQSSRHGGTMIVTADNLSRIQTILSDLWQSLSAQCTLLTDRAGIVLAQHGETNGMPMMILLPLLSTSFSTAGEVARQLREEDAMTLYMHDGARYNLYCFDIAQRFLLVVVFDKNIAATRIGSVWVEARSTIRKLKEALR